MVEERRPTSPEVANLPLQETPELLAAELRDAMRFVWKKVVRSLWSLAVVEPEFRRCRSGIHLPLFEKPVYLPHITNPSLTPKSTW